MGFIIQPLEGYSTATPFCLTLRDAEPESGSSSPSHRVPTASGAAGDTGHAAFPVLSKQTGGFHGAERGHPGCQQVGLCEDFRLPPLACSRDTCAQRFGDLYIDQEAVLELSE